MGNNYKIGETVKDYLVLELVKVNGRTRYKCECQKCKRIHVLEKKQIYLKKIDGCVDCYKKDTNDIVGKKFGNLTVIERLKENAFANEQLYLCKCDCGLEYKKSRKFILNNNYSHCRNCLFNKEHIPRLSGLLSSMKQRCYNKNNISYKNYGARGITICDEWLDEENGFENFNNWAIANGYKEEVLPNGKNKWTIDRIDVNGNYEPSNCRFVTVLEQGNNKSTNKMITYKGETHTLQEWARIYNKCPESISYRISHGYNLDQAFSNETYSHKPQLNLYGKLIYAEDLCNMLGIKYHQYRYRRKKGWSVEKIYEYFSAK